MLARLPIRWSVPARLSGTRTMRDCSASACRIACRIHHTAYGDELDPLRLVELVGGADQSEVALVDQIGEGDALVLIFLGDRHDEAQVRPDELVQRFLIVHPDALRQLDLVLARDQRIGADVAEVLVERTFFVRRLPVFRRCHAASCSLVSRFAVPGVPCSPRRYSTRSPIRCHRTRVKSGTRRSPNPAHSCNTRTIGRPSISDAGTKPQ